MSLERRAFLLGLGASLAACASSTPRVAPPVSTPLPFAFHDATEPFFAFWLRARGRPLAEQIARFRAEVVAPNPQLYTPAVLGLRSADPRELDQRLAAWLPDLAERVPRMRAIRDAFHGEVVESVQSFRHAFPDFAWNGDCYVFASIDAMNGGARNVHGHPALLFGLDVMARQTDAMPPQVLFAHELFHVYQSQVIPGFKSECVADALWVEGLATYASTVVVSHTSDRQALPFSHINDPAHPAFDLPARRVYLDQVMPERAASLGPKLLAVLGSQADDDYAQFFLGRASPQLGEEPVRSGYWFGLRIARVIAQRHDLRTLARTPPSALRGEITSALVALTDPVRPPSAIVGGMPRAVTG